MIQDHHNCLEVVKGIVDELVNRGYSLNQIASLIDTHFQRWVTYALFGDPRIKTELDNDTTNTWLGDKLGGKEIREHIKDRIDVFVSG